MLVFILFFPFAVSPTQTGHRAGIQIEFSFQFLH